MYFSDQKLIQGPMGKFSNRAQVVYAATCWVFGGDGTLTGKEQSEMKTKQDV